MPTVGYLTSLSGPSKYLRKQILNSDQTQPDTSKSDPPRQLTSVTVAAGLRAAASEVFSARDRKGLLKLSAAIERNSNIDSAVSEIPELPEDLRQIVITGVKTGRLPFLLEEYLATNRKTQTLWKSFYLSILYPVFVILFSMIVVTGFLLMAVPQFKEIFEDFGVELPLITYAMIEFVDFLEVVWKPAVSVLILVIIVFTLRGVLPFAAARARFFQAIPWIGTAQKMAASSEFCSRLAILVDCRLPLDEALMIVSNTVKDPYMRHMSRRLASRVEAGESGEELAEYSSGLPHALVNSFRWSNDPEPFADGLRSLAIVFSSQARLSTSQLVVITEPIAFIGVGLLVGLVTISMFMPLIRLLNALS